LTTVDACIIYRHLSMSTLPVIACCRPLAGPALSTEEAEATAQLFRVLGDPARVKIVNLLATSDEPVCVCELIEPLGLTQPTVSHHLKKLTEAGLLVREQRGVWAYYTLDEDALSQLGALVEAKGGKP
jgi:ArsR family transcriptional regulator